MTAGAALSLRFERDNPCNTTIVDPDGNRFYTVATDFPKPDKPVTHLHDGVGNLIAEWTWRDARSDLLTIRDRPETPASVWLKKSIIPFRDDVTFQDDAGVEYDVYIHVPRSSCLVRNPSRSLWLVLSARTGTSRWIARTRPWCPRHSSMKAWSLFAILSPYLFYFWNAGAARRKPLSSIKPERPPPSASLAHFEIRDNQYSDKLTI